MTATFGYILYTQSPKRWFDCVGAFLAAFISGFNGQYYMREVLLAAGAKYSIGQVPLKNIESEKMQ